MARTINQKNIDLNQIAVFTRVAQAGSFTAAAGALGMPKSTASRKVSDLEERLGVRLLNRTTRKLSLTDAGRAFYEHAARVVSEAEEAALVVGRMQGTPRGLVRITAPMNAAFLGPILADFLLRYHEVQVDLLCTDRVVNLVEEGFDLAFRAGHLADSTLVARSFGRARNFLVASPAYLKKRGRPKTPEDLRQHDGIMLGAGVYRDRFRLVAEGRSVEIPVSGRLIVNDFEILRIGAVSGLGIALIPTWLCAEDLRAKRLEHVLPDWCSPEVELQAVYPSTRHLAPKVRALLDHLEARMKPPPWELARDA